MVGNRSGGAVKEVEVINHRKKRNKIERGLFRRRTIVSRFFRDDSG